MSSSTSDSAAQGSGSTQTVEAKQVVEMFAKIDGALTMMNGTLTTLSERVERMDRRLGQLEGLSAAETARPEPEPASVSQAELERLQAAAEAAEEAADQFRAENASLCSTLHAIRDSCQCPIQQDFTPDMVVASDGEGYDRQAIQQWQRLHNTSPVTRERLLPMVFPNRFARRVYEELQKVGLVDPRPSEDVAPPSQDSRAAASHSHAMSAAAGPEDLPAPVSSGQSSSSSAAGPMDDLGPGATANELRIAVAARLRAAVAASNAIVATRAPATARLPAAAAAAAAVAPAEVRAPAAAGPFLATAGPAAATVGRAPGPAAAAVAPPAPAGPFLATPDAGLTAAIAAALAIPRAPRSGLPAMAAPVPLQDFPAPISFNRPVNLQDLGPRPRTQDASADLLVAIEREDEAAAIRLLQQPLLPGLNDVDQNGMTVLMTAISGSLFNVALAILARPDFTGINAKSRRGLTALCWAAFQGSLAVCQAIVGRADFTELLAVDSWGNTASQVADANEYGAVAEFLQNAEAQRRGVSRPSDVSQSSGDRAQTR